MFGCNSTHIISRRVEVNKQSEQNQLTSIWKTATKVWWFLSVTTSEKTNHSKHKIISNAACIPDAMDIGRNSTSMTNHPDPWIIQGTHALSKYVPPVSWWQGWKQMMMFSIFPVAHFYHFCFLNQIWSGITTLRENWTVLGCFYRIKTTWRAGCSPTLLCNLALYEPTSKDQCPFRLSHSSRWSSGQWKEIVPNNRINWGYSPRHFFSAV